MKKYMWIIIMVVLVVVVAASVILSGGMSTSGRFVLNGPDAAAQFQNQVGTPATVARSLSSSTIAADQQIRVTLDVRVGAADSYSIQENIPSGWTLVDSGTMTASTDKTYLTFIQLNSATDTTHFYVIKAPTSPSQVYPVSGSFGYGKTSANIFVTAQSTTGTQSISFTSILEVTSTRGILINGVVAGTGSISKTLDPDVYTVSFEDIPGYLKPSPKTVTILAGRKTSLSCYYREKDVADVDSNGDVSTVEIGAAMQWFKTTGKDSSGNPYDMAKLIYTIDRFYQGVKGGYYPSTSQCNTTTV